jgi:hypothetical protein
MVASTIGTDVHLGMSDQDIGLDLGQQNIGAPFYPSDRDSSPVLMATSAVNH